MFEFKDGKLTSSLPPGAAQAIFSNPLFQSLQAQVGSCAGCGKIGNDFKQCSACKVVKYCSVACQKNHWRTHKKVCGAKPKLRFSIGGEFQ